MAWPEESRFFTSCGWPGVCALFTWIRDSTKIHYGKKATSSVMLWAMFSWENLGPGIHLDVALTCTTYLSIVADQVHPFMATVFPGGSGLFQQDNVPCYTTQNKFRNGLRSMTKISRC